MPVNKVGKGYKWGKSGKLYVGKDAKRKAIIQGYAIEHKGGYKERRQGGKRGK